MAAEDNPAGNVTGSRERDLWLTIPNVLTLFRLLAIIPFAVLAVKGKDRSALILFVLAALTDTFDGMIARHFALGSRIGRLLDPLADKLFTGVAFVVLSAFRQGSSSIPLWVMFATLGRDILILAGSFLVYRGSSNTGFKASVYGKLNTFLEISVVVCFLSVPDVPLVAKILPGLYIVLLMSVVVSTIDYFRIGVHMLREPSRIGVGGNALTIPRSDNP